jgi:hypothetical protein
LTIVDDGFSTDEKDEELRKTNPETPDLFAFDCGQLPFERMGDAHFELLLADLYTARAKDGTDDWFDKARRLNDGADQGRDVILFEDSSPVGVIQCKRYNGIVSLAMVIQEICKFFLYATIKPGIASAPGEEFRYYVAVSDRAAGKLFEFMEGKGKKRFEDLRAEFEDKAFAARKASATLRKHTALKGLTKEQLCDLVWARIDNLHTTLHKKDDLSRMVGAYPDIKSTYFRLESDTARIVDELKTFLQTRNLVVNDEDEALVSAIRTEYVKLKLGSHHRFNLALVQGDELLPFMRGMLEPEHGTLFTNFGSRPVLLTAGAVAASPADWGELNELVKAYTSQAVAFVGCGDVTGAQLIEWKKSDDMIWIDPKWTPAPAKHYRAGWCWVKDPGEGVFNCFVLVENETGDATYGHAEVSLRLAFEDVIVWPTLGNDFTNPISNAKSQLRRIMASQKEDRSQRPNLVLASLNVGSLDKVLGSVSDHYGQRTQSTIGMAIANSGRLKACAAELYSATGIFPATDREFATRPTPMTVNPPGRVMRRSSNGALTVTIDWAADLSLQSVQTHRLVEGKVTADMAPQSLEFHELFDRYPPFDGYLTVVRTELDLLNTLVQGTGLPDCLGFTYRTCFGVKTGEDFSLEKLTSSGEYVMRAVHALSYLNVPASSQWSSAPGLEGHIRYEDPVHGEFSIMAWSNKNYHVRQMEGDLFHWARQPIVHPNLIVFAQGRGSVCDKKPSHGRYDYTSAPVPRGSITEPAIARNAYMFNLSEIESLYDDDEALSPEQFMEGILMRKEKLDAQ